MGNAYSENAPFLHRQAVFASRLNYKYFQGGLSEGRKLEFDKLNEPVIWVRDSKDLITLIKMFQQDDACMIDYLSSLTAYDNKDKVDGPKRFVVVYNLFSTTTHVRVRLKLAVDDGEAAPTITHIWPAANWLEREVWDMFGIKFDGHPNLRRIMMDERFTGHPLRKEYPIKQREPFADNIPFHLGAQPLPKSEK
ncbi:MAG: NADH-quinone oxidoreductase subunit C [Bacteriovoracaceae bacterium]|nr:NADH-quinone oxidoreductase subunit C [Bacteriovoracaceae bacterium]